MPAGPLPLVFTYFAAVTFAGCTAAGVLAQSQVRVVDAKTSRFRHRPDSTAGFASGFLALGFAARSPNELTLCQQVRYRRWTAAAAAARRSSGTSGVSARYSWTSQSIIASRYRTPSQFVVARRQRDG